MLTGIVIGLTIGPLVLAIYVGVLALRGKLSTPETMSESWIADVDEDEVV